MKDKGILRQVVVGLLLFFMALFAAGASFAADIYFPHVDANLPWQTEIAIINTSQDQTVTGTLNGFSNAGSLVESKAVTLSPLGRREINVASEFVNATGIGYIVFQTSAATVHGYVKFYQAGIYRAAIPAVKEINTSDIYIPHIDSGADWWTGISLVNTTATVKQLNITFNTGEGVVYELAAHEHRAFTIEGLYGGVQKPLIKSAVISNASGIIGLELFGSKGANQQLDGLLITDKTASTTYYPHVDSNGWWTGIVAYNPSNSENRITITPYSQEGVALASASRTLAGKEKYVGLVSSLGLPAQTAWFKIDSTLPLSGFELFGTANGSQLAAYANTAGGAKQGVFAKIEKNGGWTGIAFVNTEEGAASVTLNAYNDAGTFVAMQRITVGGHAKVVNSADNIFPEAVTNVATYIAYSSDKNVVGFQLNGSADGTMLDGLPVLSDSTPVVVIPDSDVIVNSGMTDGGVARDATQTMTGSLPNPTGSTDTYQGKAYLVINGDKIALSVTKAAAASSVVGARKIYKEGKEYYAGGIDKIAAVLPLLQEKAATPVTWVYSVTFSINAGPNTVSVEVYDENDTIYARMGPWNVVGVIVPTSLVVTLSWNTNNTDIDLHMSPDNGATHCFYRQKTAGEMKLDYDNTSGYGPEHITIDNATGTNTYKIKVYYYDDDNVNDPPGITPTTAHITASLNGVAKLDVSGTLTSASTSAGWGSGAHVWDAGEVEVVAASRYTVVLGAPDLSSFPTVRVTATVTDPSNAIEPKVEGLTASNFYVINAGKSMSPISVAAVQNVYTLTYTDIAAGKRDLFVYVSVPAQGETPMKGGLSNTRTYGKNYAVFAGLNEYPAQAVSASWFDDAAQPAKFLVRAKTRKTANAATGFTVDAGDFTITLTDSAGGTNRAPVTVAASGITAEGWDAAAGKYSYLLTLDRPANYLDYDHFSAKFKKEIWLSWCVKDTTDLKAALLAKGTGMSNTSWESANFTSYLNSAATKGAILDQIGTYAGLMNKYDMLLFHFSGHGSGMPAAGAAAQYLCAYEDNGWINVNDLKGKLDLVPSPGGGIANVFVFMDACHSGNFISKDLARGIDVDTGADVEMILKYRPFIPQGDEGPLDPRMVEFRDLTALSNTFVMAAQTGSSSAWDDGGLQNGVFTHYLVQGIKVSGKYFPNASGNSNRDVWITGEEAFAYLDPLTRARVTVANGYGAADFQHPQVQDNNGDTSALLIYNW